MQARLILMHLRLRVISLHLQHRLLADAVLGAHSRDKVDEEGEDVEGEDEGDGPFEDGGRIEIIFPALYTECWDWLADGAPLSLWGLTYCQSHLDDNKGELNPKRRPQHTMLAEI